MFVREDRKSIPNSVLCIWIFILRSVWFFHDLPGESSSFLDSFQHLSPEELLLRLDDGSLCASLKSESCRNLLVTLTSFNSVVDFNELQENMWASCSNDGCQRSSSFACLIDPRYVLMMMSRGRPSSLVKADRNPIPEWCSVHGGFTEVLLILVSVHCFLNADFSAHFSLTIESLCTQWKEDATSLSIILLAVIKRKKKSITSGLIINAQQQRSSSGERNLLSSYKYNPL